MKTSSKLGLVAVSILALGAAACGSGDKGDAGPAGQPGPQGQPGATGSNGTGVTSFSLIEPRTAVLARDIDVVVSVQGIKLDAAPALDFGDAKITVSNVQVVSDTTLYAHVKIDGTATIGKKDVKITTGGTPLTGTGAFEVKAGMDITVTPAQAKQGTIVNVEMTNNDPENPFDPNAFTVPLPAGLDAISPASASSGKKASFTAIVDPTAAPGSSQLTGSNGDANVYLTAPGAFTIVANPPVALSGTKNETLSNAGDSLLYSYSTNNDVIVSFNIKTTATATTVPQALILPASGTFADALAILEVPQVPDPQNPFGSLPAPPPYDVTVSYPMSTTAAATQYAMVNDLATQSGSKSTLAVTLTTTTAAAFSEAAGAHADLATAQSATACIASNAVTPCLIKGSIAADTEIDVYKVTTLSANTTLEVSAYAEKAGVSVYAIDAAKNSVDSADSDLVSAVGLGPSVTAAHTASSNTTSALKSWVIVVTGNSGDPTGAYTLGIRTAP